MKSLLYKKKYPFFYLPFLFLLFLSPVSVSAQILHPASWSTEISDKTVGVGDKVDLIFHVEIQKDWYLYSSDFDPELGPMVTEFIFLPDKSYELVGDIKPIGAKKKYDDLWGGEYTYFTKKAEFRQTVKILNQNPIIKGSYTYQVCSDVDGKCIPFDDEFEFSEFTVTASSSF